MGGMDLRNAGYAGYSPVAGNERRPCWGTIVGRESLGGPGAKGLRLQGTGRPSGKRLEGWAKYSFAFHLVSTNTMDAERWPASD